jgi:hypothetical protein
LTTHRERQRVRARRRANRSFIAHLRAGFLPNFNADIVDALARCPLPDSGMLPYKNWGQEARVFVIACTLEPDRHS